MQAIAPAPRALETRHNLSSPCRRCAGGHHREARTPQASSSAGCPSFSRRSSRLARVSPSRRAAPLLLPPVRSRAWRASKASSSAFGPSERPCASAPVNTARAPRGLHQWQECAGTAERPCHDDIQQEEPAQGRVGPAGGTTGHSARSGIAEGIGAHPASIAGAGGRGEPEASAATHPALIGTRQGPAGSGRRCSCYRLHRGRAPAPASTPRPPGPCRRRRRQR